MTRCERCDREECPECGVAFVDHLGLTGTCARALRAESELAAEVALCDRLALWVDAHSFEWSEGTKGGEVANRPPVLSDYLARRGKKP